MAFAARAVLEAAEVHDPRPVRRLAVRFSAPLLPGDTVTTPVWRIEAATGSSHVDGDGRPGIKDGPAELR